MDIVISGFGDIKIYVVQMLLFVVVRCIVMIMDLGDFVFDLICGLGMIVYIVEQWGCCWIIVDILRVVLVFVRVRVIGVRFLYYFLWDSLIGKQKEVEVIRIDCIVDDVLNDIC